MRRHPIVGHGAPGMIRERGLRIPDVAAIASQLSALQGTHHRVPIAESAARRVDQIATAFHQREHLVIEHALRRWIKLRLEIYDIADFDE